jgi:hypothetical protein
MKTSLPAHPFLFTLAFLLFLYLITDVIVPPNEILRPLLALWIVLTLLIWLAYWITRDWDWAGLLLTIFVLGVYLSSQFFIVAAVTSAALILLWLGFTRLRRRRVNIREVTVLLNIASLFLVVILSFPTISQLARLPASYFSAVRVNDRPLLATPAASGDLPDIYYIVLDGYVRSDILEEYFQFDNSDIEQFLRSRDFVIPENSHSNYPKTALSVTSTLNMNYIQDITPDLEQSYYWWLMSPLIDHSQTRAMLEQVGYKTVSITTDWGITDNPTTDIYYQPAPVVLNDLEGMLLATTPLGSLKPILSNFTLGRSLEAHRQLVRFNFDSLQDIPEIPGPKFVFAHIVSPHPPFVFDKNGDPLDQGYGFTFNDGDDYPLSAEDYRQGYVGQVEFVNRELKTMIDAILQKSAAPPIIILQADHGSGMLTDFGSVENTCLRERFSNFAAYYLPGADKNTIPSDITPVNLFRIIFNEYFSTQLPLLESKHYYYEDFVFIYSSVDVSTDVNTCSRN